MLWQTMNDLALVICLAECKEAYLAFSWMIANRLKLLMRGHQFWAALKNHQVILSMEIRLQQPAHQLVQVQHRQVPVQPVPVQLPPVHQPVQHRLHLPVQLQVRVQLQLVVQHPVQHRQVQVQQLQVQVLRQPVAALLQRHLRQVVLQARQVRQLKQSKIGLWAIQ